ncbi:sensor histidine kinase [Cellulosilyticum sp. I15G10I2]|uniref:sensor histidine kinase n=1 Tax=Cellulosilyticum sp. I15G10I2 TaxID=1892843 RepID=UPI00085BD7B1|nr:sensor histidine kinase [Cellulosilyticum sp. I15G10I2]
MYKNLSLRSKLFIQYCIFAILFTSMITYLVYSLFYLKLQENKVDYTLEISNRTKYNLEFLLTSIDNTATLLSNDEEIRNKLSQYNDDKEYINTILKNTVTVQEYIKGVYILGNNGKVYTSDWAINEDLLKQKYNHLLQEKDVYDLFTKSYSRDYHISSTMKVLTYVRKIYDYRVERNYGTLIIDINYDSLRDLITTVSVANPQKLLIVNEAGETLFTYPYNVILDDVLIEYPDLLQHKDLKITGHFFKKRSIIVSNTIKHTNWTLIGIHPMDKILEDSKNILHLMFKTAAIFLFLSLFSAYALSYAITKPIIELANTMHLVEAGNLSVPVKVRSNDELGALALAFNNMLKKLNYFINKAIEVEQQKSNMEFQILQAQINPHFLYNTLDSIRWLATFHNIKTISTMVTCIINLLKYNFSRKGEVVRLDEELDNVKAYLYIQKYRYGDMFDVIYDIPNELLNCYTIKFILQPIVENSIFHGLEDLDTQGLITISAHLDKEYLFLTVKDNGVGMTEEQLENARKGKSSDKKYNEIGIKNIDERIKFYCGSAFGLGLSSIKNAGTIVTIKLPANLKEDDAIHLKTSKKEEEAVSF